MPRHGNAFPKNPNTTVKPHWDGIIGGCTNATSSTFPDLELFLDGRIDLTKSDEPTPMLEPTRDVVNRLSEMTRTLPISRRRHVR
ncbi:hypothetical protein CRI94_08360 [Longibacter salinarum]|uniref:Uncharacterized protein n=1 Tax=Longibacter salinarum TaxID=1850348 RepID=A0A2A8CZG5_9BACT|nr:hypothetical protein CRI94_08360 [Longibacter salinarum]